MSIELEPPAVDLHLQEEKKNDDRPKEMELEIECPRCADMMTLSSEFDRLEYLSGMRLITCHELDTLTAIQKLKDR
jgi:hypothetical protein